MGAVGRQQPPRLIHHLLEHVGRFTQDGDAPTDLTQRALLLGAVAQLGLRARQLLDEARVGERCGSVVSQRLDQRCLGLTEGAGPAGVDAQGAHQLVVGYQGGHGHGADARSAGDLVGHPGMREGLVAGVVVGDAHGSLGGCLADHADAQRQHQGAHPGAFIAGADAGIADPAQRLAVGLEQIGDGAVGLEQPRRLVHGVTQRVDGARLRSFGRFRCHGVLHRPDDGRTGLRP